ncbi:hypothetical protein [Sphingomonas crocodyli]|uniref:Flagellar FliJ protein n=1 Tax=Sphingomonas crocodyli TaxID=1979270 RepID=A0A437MAI7_9SPHN|nr:hypothetical protein [Sphingomonas crocodyli]RVT94655.1 hypothetical protein EOD43_12715 [Sphingomonas crocodyli]
MKAMAERRARVARIRGAQHLLAAAEQSNADAKVAQLEMSVTRLAELRDSLTVPVGATSGAALQNRGELANRLDKARHSMGDAIASAKVLASQRAAERLEARQKQEGAEKLDARAGQALAAWLEQRSAVPFRRRPGHFEKGDY